MEDRGNCGAMDIQVHAEMISPLEAVEEGKLDRL